jgi:hypothetical protein
LSPRFGLQADEEIGKQYKAALRRNPARIHAAVAISGPAHTASPSKEYADRGIALDVASAVSSPKVSIVEEDWWFQNCHLQKEDNHWCPCSNYC